MRILEITAPTFDGPDGSEVEVGLCNVAIDLEAVMFVRATDDDDPPGDCVIYLANGRQWRVRETYASVVRAWKTYREGADALARIRN